MRTRTFLEFVRAIIKVLNETGLEYAITGALAASYYGRPRTTVDADFIVRVSPRNLEGFLAKVRSIGLEGDVASVRNQLETGYNIISLMDKHSAHQADFIFQAWGRVERRKGFFLRLPVYYQSPEDLILAKLRMVKATRPRERSLKDREDVQAIVAGTRVDRARLLRAAKRQGTLEIIISLLPKRKGTLARKRGA